MKLVDKYIYTGTIRLVSGLHIGGANTALNIGGIDNAVIRNPLTGEPYIPGSSLKGKMRSLIEMKYGETNAGKPTESINTKAGALFGVSASSSESHPSRIIVRDAMLMNKGELEGRTDVPYTETKAEVNINRITAKPISGVRYTERVPAGAIFSLNIVLNVFEHENIQDLEQTLKESLNLLQNDYLGGSGSRGYGQIVFENLKKHKASNEDKEPFVL